MAQPMGGLNVGGSASKWILMAVLYVGESLGRVGNP